MRDELAVLRQQLDELQARVSNLQLEADPPPRPQGETEEDDDDRDREQASSVGAQLTELQQRLANRLRHFETG